jgi:hypothetical protein
MENGGIYRSWRARPLSPSRRGEWIGELCHILKTDSGIFLIEFAPVQIGALQNRFKSFQLRFRDSERLEMLLSSVSLHGAFGLTNRRSAHAAESLRDRLQQFVSRVWFRQE